MSGLNKTFSILIISILMFSVPVSAGFDGLGSITGFFSFWDCLWYGICDDEPVCGDTSCDSGEDCNSCSQDCGSCNVVEPPVNSQNNPAASSNSCGSFGGTECVARGTSCSTGKEDTGAKTLDCDSGYGVCCKDVAPNLYCTDGSCNNGENCDSCPQDCGACMTNPQCGNGQIESGEQCEGSNLNGRACSEIGKIGNPFCDNCAVNFDTCQVNQNPTTPVCGNLVKEVGEECDTNGNFFKSCVQYDSSKYESGNIFCTLDCRIANFNECVLKRDPNALPVCGNKIVEAGEECDLGNGEYDSDVIKSCADYDSKYRPNENVICGRSYSNGYDNPYSEPCQISKSFCILKPSVPGEGSCQCTSKGVKKCEVSKFDISGTNEVTWISGHLDVELESCCEVNVRLTTNPDVGISTTDRIVTPSATAPYIWYSYAQSQNYPMRAPAGRYTPVVTCSVAGMATVTGSGNPDDLGN